MYALDISLFGVVSVSVVVVASPLASSSRRLGRPANVFAV